MGISLRRALTITSWLGARPPEGTVETLMRKLYVSAARRRNPVEVWQNGRHIRIFHRRTAADLFVVWQCFYKQQYEIPISDFHPPFHRTAVQAWYHETLNQGKRPLIIDCGANIGTSSLWFRARYPEARIIAIEPAPDNATLLRQNCASTGIDVIEGAVAAQDGQLLLVNPDESTNGYRTAPIDGGDMAAGSQVRALSLATILARDAAAGCEPFILKVDIEGGEKTFFTTGWPSFDRFPLVILEQHDFMMPGQSTGESFLLYHAARRRDFLYGAENIFSIDYGALTRNRETYSTTSSHGVTPPPSG